MSLFACIRTPHAFDAAIAIARAFSPRVERHGPGCVVCDVSGLGRLLGEPPVIGAELWRSRETAGNGGSVAIAPTQIAARILAHAATGLTVVGHPATALAAVPIRVLHAMLVAQRTGAPPSRGVLERYARIEQAFEVFDRWGLSTLGDLASLPADALSARLGRIGVELRSQACGVDLDPLVPAADVPRFLERIELEWPIDGLEPLAFVLARLLEPLSVALERADRGAAAIHLDLRLVDRSTHARMLQLPAAIRDPRVLRTLLTLDLESHPPPAAVEVVTTEIDPAPARVVQYSLLERARPSVETLATLIARLSALVGETRIGAAALLDSHGPDAFAMSAFAPAETGRAGSGPPCLAEARRAKADANGSLALRRFRPPIAVRVDVDHGRPVRVAIARRGLPSGHVEQCAGPWRGSGEWWAHDAQRWDRDEWDVALSDGAVCRLFRARDTGVWFLEGVVD
jgi:protein ImuB